MVVNFLQAQHDNVMWKTLLVELQVKVDDRVTNM
jgi:hypothetical protein